MTSTILLGIDVGGTTTKMGFISTDGEIQHKWELVTDTRNQGSHIIDDIAKSVEKKLLEFGYEKKQLIGVGLGAPGAVNIKTGVIYEAVNLGWKLFPLKRNLENAFNIPAAVDNDANCAALGEMWQGAGEGAKDVVCVTLGTGVGGGIIANGEVVHGIMGAGGEIGHITAVPEGGSPCNCGKRGCLETVASATGIVRIAKEMLMNTNKKTLLNKGNISAKAVFDAAKEKDELALEIVERVSFYLGLALSHLGNTLNPEKIVIGGGVSQAGNVLLDPVSSFFRAFTFPTVQRSTSISTAKLGNDAGIVGAAWLAKELEG